MPRYFISYRRDDVPGHTGRLYDTLVREFGADRIFMDVNRMSPGEDFVDNLDDALRAADAIIAVIGPRWLAAEDPVGKRRIDDPADFVRRELRAALDRDLPVIPVLMSGAAMPRSVELPEAIEALSRRQAVAISDAGWATDVQQLTAALADVKSMRRRPPPARWETSHEVEGSPEWARLDYHGPVHDIAYAPDGSRLAAATADGARVWDVDAGQELQRFLAGHRVTGVAVSPDGTALATAGDDGSRIWDIATGEQRAQAWDSATVAVLFSPDGRLLISRDFAGPDGSANVCDGNDGRYLKSLYGSYYGYVKAVAFAPDARVLATLGATGRLRIYDPESLEELHCIEDATTFAFSPDGHWLSYATRDGDRYAVVVRDVKTFKTLTYLPHRNYVNALEFSADGCLLGTSSEEFVFFWDFREGNQTVKLPHRAEVAAIAFSPDGRLLAVRDYGDTVTLWSVSIAEEAGRLRHDDKVTLVSFSPDGATLATTSAEAIYIWRRLP